MLEWSVQNILKFFEVAGTKQGFELTRDIFVVICKNFWGKNKSGEIIANLMQILANLYEILTTTLAGWADFFFCAQNIC